MAKLEAVIKIDISDAINIVINGLLEEFETGELVDIDTLIDGLKSIKESNK